MTARKHPPATAKTAAVAAASLTAPVSKASLDEQTLYTELHALIERSRQRLAGAVNAELTQLYWAIGARLQGGVFFNYYLTPSLRVTNNLLAGSGRDRHGASWTVGLQHVTRALAPHHSVSLAADLTMVNRSHNESYFGVNLRDNMNSGNMPYAPGGGLRDVAVSARWNWALSPGWMISSGARAARLQGDARRSPLVERANNITVSTGLAYRF